MAYTGAWRKSRRAEVMPALIPGLDPDHSDPPLDEERRQIREQTGPPVPTLPMTLTGAAYTAPVRTGGGPIDATPMSHDVGMGVGPGLTLEQSQERSSAAHSVDYGGPEAHRWAPAARRGPREVTRTPYSQGPGDSPDTLRLHRTGYGQATDPGARRPLKVVRNADGRRYTRRGWGVDWRERRVRAVGVLPATVDPDGTQYVSPEPRYGPTRVTPDTEVTPIERVSPLMDIGVPARSAATGLPSWGL